MPILKNAQKALRASKRKATYNRRVKSIAKTATDALKDNPSAENLQKAQSAIDKAAKKNIFGKNKAARMKAGLYKLSKKAGVKLEAAAPKKKVAKKASTTKKKAVDSKKTAKSTKKASSAKKTTKKSTKKTSPAKK